MNASHAGNRIVFEGRKPRVRTSHPKKTKCPAQERTRLCNRSVALLNYVTTWSEREGLSTKLSAKHDETRSIRRSNALSDRDVERLRRERTGALPGRPRTWISGVAIDGGSHP